MEPHAELLLRKSADDRAVLDHPLPPTILGVHAQQAREKLVKALLAELGCDYPRTHNLGAPGELIELHDRPLPVFPLPLHGLNDYAVPYRYDDLPPGFEVDAVGLRGTVDDLRAHVEGRSQALFMTREQKPFKDADSEPDRQDQHPLH